MDGRRLYSFPLPAETDPVAVFSAFYAQPYSLFFDSADRAHPDSKYSMIAFAPFETITAHGTSITRQTSDETISTTGDPFAFIEDRLTAYGFPAKTKKDGPPFQGGAAGYWGYDLARTIEDLPARSEKPETPDMMVGLYDQLIAFDHATGQNSTLIWAKNEDAALERFEGIAEQLARAHQSPFKPIALEWQTHTPRKDYLAHIQKVIAYIYAGDIFQANLSQRFEAALPKNFNPFAHYTHLRAINPAPFGAYMNFGELHIASSSPERFLSVRARKVETKPIKGTRPRAAQADKDERHKQSLLNSEKDRAENVMIVDLLRNDLSKACEDHSLDVPKLCALESFAHVHHLVSTITATLRIDKSPLDLLRAAFPGGSITGAPKVRAMEIIEELETHPRGPYCGALGYIGFDGTMDTNIAIRTLIYENDTIRFNTGGGITAISTPEDEYQETLDKAQGLVNSFAPTEIKQEEAA